MYNNSFLKFLLVSVEIIFFKGMGTLYRARIFKLLWSPGIGSKEPIPPAYLAWCVGPNGNPIPSYSVPSPHRLFKNTSTFMHYICIYVVYNIFLRKGSERKELSCQGDRSRGLPLLEPWSGVQESYFWMR